MTPAQGADPLAVAAAANNADLCAAVLDAHGVPWRRTASHLMALAAPPRFYPDLVTLDPDDAGGQVAAIRRLGALREGPLAVKDSFGTLDLSGAGFTILFAAAWIRVPGAPAATLPPGWQVVRTVEGLADWEAAWAGGEAVRGVRIFPDAILRNPDLTVLARRSATAITAGCIVNRSASVAGLSNLHGTGAGLWSEALDAVRACAPGLDIVGYESGAGLAAAVRAGARSGGRLRVLHRDGPHRPS